MRGEERRSSAAIGKRLPRQRGNAERKSIHHNYQSNRVSYLNTLPLLVSDKSVNK